VRAGNAHAHTELTSFHTYGDAYSHTHGDAYRYTYGDTCYTYAHTERHSDAHAQSAKSYTEAAADSTSSAVR
jgi:hypothetical protein